MYKDSELTKSTYKLKEIATMLGVTTITLKNWELSGKIEFNRTPTNIRFLSRDQLINVFCVIRYSPSVVMTGFEMSCRKLSASRVYPSRLFSRIHVDFPEPGAPRSNSKVRIFNSFLLRVS